MITASKSVLGLDVGGKRVGVAVASMTARLPRPLATLEQGDHLLDSLGDIVKSEDVGAFVVGLPRGMEGQHTAQTAEAEAFAESIRSRFDLPVYMQDEAVTSKQAEEELKARGKPYGRGDIDALAATYILQDWLAGHRKGKP
ncbi:MAG TPA: Holliday junction resolvase RuvX [Candidatus Saccharimonadales bacterium]|nr:Holliday junction resolvase RuvX [Candidatus Saccharimonadales bacterium]